jgi:hypothetical protein
VPFAGCVLVQADDTNPKMIPPGVDVGVKLEIKGWERAGDVLKARLGGRVHVTLITDLEMTVDDIHRTYGPGIYFAQAYTLNPTTGAMAEPIMGQTHTILPCVFDEPDRETDPEEPEQDVGTEVWPISARDLQANPALRKEMQRRKDMIKDLEEGFDSDRPGHFDSDRGSRNGPDRGSRNDAYQMLDPDMGLDGDSGIARHVAHRGARGEFRRLDPRDVAREEPEWMFDQSVKPLAKPPTGFEWVFGGSPMKWHHGEKAIEPIVVPPPVVVPPAPERPSFFESTGGAAMVTGLLTALATIGAKLAEPKPLPPPPPPPPDLATTMATLMAAMSGMQTPRVNPVELKQLEIEAEDKRAAAALAAEEKRSEREEKRAAEARALAEQQRLAALEAEDRRVARETLAREALALAAKAQRDHELSIEQTRRDAAAREARDLAAAAEAAKIATEERIAERAKAEQLRMIALKQSGLIAPEGATPAQVQAQIAAATAAQEASFKSRLEMEQLRAQMDALKGQKSEGVLDAFEKAKSLLSKLGVKVGEESSTADAVSEALNSEAAKAMAPALAEPIKALLMKLVGGQPAAPAPLQTQVTVQRDLQAEEAAIKRREQIAYETGLENMRQHLLQQQAAQEPTPVAPPSPVEPVPPQRDPLQWHAVAAPPPVEPVVQPMQWTPAEMPVVEPTPVEDALADEGYGEDAEPSDGEPVPESFDSSPGIDAEQSIKEPLSATEEEASPPVTTPPAEAVVAEEFAVTVPQPAEGLLAPSEEAEEAVAETEVEPQSTVAEEAAA